MSLATMWKYGGSIWERDCWVEGFQSEIRVGMPGALDCRDRLTPWMKTVYRALEGGGADFEGADLG